MAKIVDTNYSGKFNLPIPVGRLNPTPLDSTEVWDTLEQAQYYAANGATAYVGQILFIKELSKHYVIKTESGELVQLSDGGKEYVRSGYLFNGEFYVSSTYAEVLPRELNVIYIDINSRQTYTFDGEQYTRSTPIATNEVAGLVKLYDELGDNVDGTMTQRAITEGIKNGVIDADDEVLFLTHIDLDNMYVEKNGWH